MTFTNPYDQTTQQARMQTPSAYRGAPTPLVVVVHPRSSDMFWGEEEGYHAAAEQKGWFYVAPQLHGSWPGTTAFPTPNPPGKFAYASRESQYDIVGSIQYLVEHYNIDPNHIYIYGQSMGAQVAAVTTAKFPHLFAAAFYNSYSQSLHKQWMERECFQVINGVPTPQTPSQNPFCYQRRSSLTFAENFLHVPISMTHSSADLLAPVNHSSQLRDAINSNGPDYPVELFVDTVVGPTCTDGAGEPTPYYHCYANDPMQVLAFLAQFTRNDRPTRLRIKTDESNAFYWLKLDLTGGEHWSRVEASYDRDNATVTARITDPNPPVLGFNLGSAALTDIIAQPGMDLPLTTYLVQEEGQPAYLVDYSGGYLTTALHMTGEVGLTIK
jgi:dienelactone hydrolase